MYASGDRKCHFQGHVTLTSRSPVKVTTLAYIPLTFLSLKNLETKKNHCCSMYTSRDRKCHFQGHVTLTYKVTRQGHDIRLYAIDFSELKNFRNKKNHCCSMYTSRDRKCHFQGHVTLTYKVNRQGHDIRLYAIWLFVSWKTLEKKKKSLAVACIQAEIDKCHFQGHVTLTYKVNRQGHDIRLYSIDFPEVKKYRNKKNHCCSMYTSRDRKCHF